MNETFIYYTNAYKNENLEPYKNGLKHKQKYIKCKLKYHKNIKYWW